MAGAANAATDGEDLYERLIALSTSSLFHLYGEMLPDDAGGAAAVARALKDKARAGAFDADKQTAIALLTFCLCDAPSGSAAFHLAKALAAFGREAQVAAPYVVDHVLETRVVDDESFWVFDGLLYALGFLGGPAAKAMLDAVAKDKPPRCAKKSAVYEGSMPLGERAAHHAETLERVGAMLSADPGPWRSRRTKLERLTVQPNRTPRGFWLARR